MELGFVPPPFSLSFYLAMNIEEKPTIEMQEAVVVVNQKEEPKQETQITPEKKDAVVVNKKEEPKQETQIDLEKKEKDSKREKALDKAAINYRFTKKSAFGMILVAFAAVFGRYVSCCSYDF